MKQSYQAARDVVGVRIEVPDEGDVSVCCLRDKGNYYPLQHAPELPHAESDKPCHCCYSAVYDGDDIIADGGG